MNLRELQSLTNQVNSLLAVRAQHERFLAQIEDGNPVLSSQITVPYAAIELLDGEYQAAETRLLRTMNFHVAEYHRQVIDVINAKIRELGIEPEDEAKYASQGTDGHAGWKPTSFVSMISDAIAAGARVSPETRFAEFSRSIGRRFPG